MMTCAKCKKGKGFGCNCETEKEAVNDLVNNPAHYTAGGVETIDYLKAKMTKEQFRGFLIGNVLKYVSRYPHKNGVEDLKKADWYLNKLIQLES